MTRFIVEVVECVTGDVDYAVARATQQEAEYTRRDLLRVVADAYLVRVVAENDGHPRLLHVVNDGKGDAR